MIKLSVIVPVYNVKDYIGQCINSIVNQSIDSMEIIVVDDGSTDSSIEVVEQIKDSRIKIIRKLNGGLSSARNEGLKVAKGKYVYFIDSDDYIAFDTALEEMYNIGVNENADIIVGNAIRYCSAEKQYEFKRDKEIFKRICMKSDEFLIKSLETYSMYSPVWFNMYKTTLLKDNKLFFKEGFFHEDEDFTPRVFLRASNISIYPKNIYIYRFREESIMGRKSEKHGHDIINICVGLEEEFKKIKNEKLKALLSDRTVELLLATSYEYNFKRIEKDIRKFAIRNSYNTKLKLHALLYNFSNNVYYKYLDIRNKYERIKIVYES